MDAGNLNDRMLRVHDEQCTMPNQSPTISLPECLSFLVEERQGMRCNEARWMAMICNDGCIVMHRNLRLL